MFSIILQSFRFKPKPLYNPIFQSSRLPMTTVHPIQWFSKDQITKRKILLYTETVEKLLNRPCKFVRSLKARSTTPRKDEPTQLYIAHSYPHHKKSTRSISKNPMKASTHRVQLTQKLHNKSSSFTTHPPVSFSTTCSTMPLSFSPQQVRTSLSLPQKSIIQHSPLTLVHKKEKCFSARAHMRPPAGRLR